MAKVSSTKQNICENAKRLFNEKGYSQVSLREIAEAADTTIGNLTYHFPQKENLIEAIQEDLHAGFAENFFVAQNEDDLLFNLLQSFKNAEENEKVHSFYYRNLAALCTDSKLIAEKNEEFREKLYQYYLHCFTKLKEYKYIRPDIPEKLLKNLAFTIVVMTTVWTQNASPYYDEKLPRVEIFQALADLLFPYFTQMGIQKYVLFLEQIG